MDNERTKENNFSRNSELSFQKNNFKTLNFHTSTILHLCQLKDGRLVSCAFDGLLTIYNKNSFNFELSIKEHFGPIRSIVQLNDERIITCSQDKTMKIIKLIGEDKYEIDQTLTGHKDWVINVIEIKENELISISKDPTMKVWIINNQNKFECITNICLEESFKNIIKINEKEFAISSCYYKYIKFWNSINYTYIISIEDIIIVEPIRIMCMLNEDILSVGGSQGRGFYLIKISTHQLIKTIIGPYSISSIVKCRDGLILCAVWENKNYSIVKYKYENQNLIKIFEKEKAHKRYIWSCIELNDKILASGGEDNLIKLWK